MNRSIAALFSLTLFLSLATIVNAQAPLLINFQAQVLEGTVGSTASVGFAIFNAPTAGTMLWSESYPSLPVQGGRVRVLLGSQTPLDPNVFENDGDRFLAITVNGETLSPRSRLTSVAYALRAAVADRVAGGGTAGVASLNTLTGDVTLVGGDNVSITPEGQSLRIDAAGGGGTGGITTINAGTGIAVLNNNGPTTEISVAPNAITDAQVADNSLSAISLGDNSVGSAEIAPDAVGSEELAPRVTLGSNGQLLITNPAGAQRVDLSTLNNGGYLRLDAADGQDAVTIESQNGFYGRITLHTLEGKDGIRIWGDQSVTDPETGDPLRGGAFATMKRDGDNVSVWIRTNGTADNNSWGVLQLANAAGNPSILLNGKNGDVSIAGNLSKGSGSFKIDHPLDPANKYLSHSFVESPDMMNVYNGNAVLDENGEAWVELPTWFEALNRDFRYQLTCIGGFAPVFVARKIENNRFQIAGGALGLEVSWQVTGIRQDPYAEMHRIQVEEEKSPSEKGQYLHPDAYGAAQQ